MDKVGWFAPHHSWKIAARIRAGAPQRIAAADVVPPSVVVVVVVSTVVVDDVVAFGSVVVVVVFKTMAETITSAAAHISSTLPPAPHRARNVTSPELGAVHACCMLVVFAAASETMPLLKVPPLDTSLCPSEVVEVTVTMYDSPAV